MSEPRHSEPKSVRGCCPVDCPDTCSWRVETNAGIAVRLRGDPDHPYTRGVLCNKLKDFIDYSNDPKRLLHPLRRSGAKGSGSFERISWDDALGEIAEKWLAIIDQHGPQSIWPYYGTGSTGMIQGVEGAGRRLWNRLGVVEHQMTICTIAGGVGTGYTLGHNQIGMDPEQLAKSKLIILWGTNTLTSNHHLWRAISTARKSGAHLVVIDPIRSRTAEKADEHFAPIPGTDAALALGLLHVVVQLGAEDQDFIERHTKGWAVFRERILQYPPEKVARITGLAADKIVALGTRLAHTRPNGIRMMMGIQRHGGGGMAVRTISCIPGVTGDWRHPGGGAAYDTRGFFPGNWQNLWKNDLRGATPRRLPMTKLAEGLLDLDDPPINALLVYAGNPVASNPDQVRVRKGLSRKDHFTVVVEHRHTDTTSYADIVLPSTMQIEHADLHHSYGHTYVAWNEPAVAAPGECLPHSEIFRQLARRLNLTDACLYDDDTTLAAAVLDSDALRRQGITLESLKRRGWAKLALPEAPFANGFPTPSTRLEFYSEKMAADGLDPVAGYTPPYETTANDHRYRLSLIAPAAHYFLNSTFADIDLARERQGKPPLFVHPVDARERKIADGTVVRVFNDRGEFTARMSISDAVRPGVVASVRAHWPRFSAGGGSVNTTVAERNSDMRNGAIFHDNRVEIRAA